MHAANTILVVAPDPGLRRSLEFALEVEGFPVESHESLSTIEASPEANAAACIIVDESAIRLSPAGRQPLARFAGRVILLVEEVDPTAGPDGFAVLTKPVEGNDLIDLVQTILARRLSLTK
ncbi:transcriptional regulator [Mesorhizobium sp. AR10]|uniref:transcriptional regulator n=1 Tax=Mesorhizobium sp. AR10 TaxID=2865839 RepID=UPI00215F9A76|nr:transcriptional regulator [Mesorhizobium sp. AR10]UVK38537.1 transcriptional regulator [Mesorhizobium sp. AR10]